MSRRVAAQKLTPSLVKALKSDKPGGVWLGDSALPGFGVIAYPPSSTNPAGVKVFVVRYTNEGGQRRLVTLGRFGVLTVESARGKAMELLSRATLGGDPAAESQTLREESTFKAWAAAYLKEVEARKKSWKEDKRYLEWAGDEWGDVKLNALTAEEVKRVLDCVAKDHGKTTANRWLASVRASLSEAWRVSRVRENVAKKVRAFPENPPRDRVLDADELQAVIGAVTETKDAYTRAAVQLLIETGARESEVLKAQWAHIDLAGMLWRLPSPKAGKPQVIPLTSSTAALLHNLPRLGAFVIPGAKPDKPRSRGGFYKQWKEILKAAEVTGVTVHDVRRTFGLAVARTAGLHVASKLLRHSDIRVTERVYAPLGMDDLRKASEKVQRQRKTGGKVLPMRAKKAVNDGE